MRPKYRPSSRAPLTAKMLRSVRACLRPAVLCTESPERTPPPNVVRHRGRAHSVAAWTGSLMSVIPGAAVCACMKALLPPLEECS